MSHGRRFRTDENTEVLVALFGDFFQVAFETVETNEPALHQMNVLEHDPGTVLGGIEKGFLGTGFLSLTHRNIDEFAISN
jgi:hypothetical protein